MAKIPHSKIKISLEFAILKVIQFATVTQISRSINPDVFANNMERNSDLQNTWSSCAMQMLKRQTRMKGAVSTTSQVLQIQSFRSLATCIFFSDVQQSFGTGKKKTTTLQITCFYAISVVYIFSTRCQR